MSELRSSSNWYISHFTWVMGRFSSNDSQIWTKLYDLCYDNYYMMTCLTLIMCLYNHYIGDIALLVETAKAHHITYNQIHIKMLPFVVVPFSDFT